MSGSVVCLDSNGKPNSFSFIPSVEIKGKRNLNMDELREKLAKLKGYGIYVEKPSSMPGQGVSSTFKFGVGLGSIAGILCGLQLPFVYVLPRVWTGKYHQKNKEISPKEKSLKAFLGLWPELESFIMELPKYKREALVDASLIARYGFDYSDTL